MKQFTKKEKHGVGVRASSKQLLRSSPDKRHKRRWRPDQCFEATSGRLLDYKTVDGLRMKTKDEWPQTDIWTHVFDGKLSERIELSNTKHIHNSGFKTKQSIQKRKNLTFICDCAVWFIIKNNQSCSLTRTVTRTVLIRPKNKFQQNIETKLIECTLL